MSQHSEAHSSSVPPDRGLPPVEPPSARFILQLFVVPAVIVTIIVLVWLLFNWLAQMGSDPTKYVATLRSNSKARWQAAASLADVLNDSRNAGLKRDHHLAQELASLLADELKQTSPGDEQVMLEAFLCRALGQFEVQEVIPPLLEAAGRTGAEEIAMRRAALEGLAIFASNVPARDNPAASQIDAVLIAAAGDADPQIRSVAAFALGVQGDRAAIEQLHKLLSDVYPDVRFNAAAGLARHANPAGLAVILEMLEPVEQAPKNDAEDASAQGLQHSLVAVNGLQAALAIYPGLPAADQTTLRSAVEKLKRDKRVEVRVNAEEILHKLDEAPAPEPAA